jgi:hypothetical protein
VELGQIRRRLVTGKNGKSRHTYKFPAPSRKPRYSKGQVKSNSRHFVLIIFQSTSEPEDHDQSLQSQPEDPGVRKVVLRTDDEYDVVNEVGAVPLNMARRPRYTGFRRAFQVDATR